MVRPAPTRRPPASGANGFNSARSLVLGIGRLLSLSLASAAHAAPINVFKNHHEGDLDDDETPVWVYAVSSMVLVLAGGVFAGLTIALMGQDGIYLQVVSRDESEPQQKNAKRVYDLLMRGKHWVLVTLLLANVIVNESLPVVLDRFLGGGLPAIFGSTVLIVIFGEIIPQSLCVRYGLQIGGYMSKPVLLLMWAMAPIGWPIAKLLDWVLGEDHGTVYKKSGLKTLVTLHRSLGEVEERLNQDEVTIISAVLDLKGKPVETVMTPMDDVFVMSEDTVLDENMMDMILSAGYSRIPIHEPENPTNFVGMLLVKMLITYDPEDCKPVRSFPLAALPETRPETSCLDIVNFFQEGKSHMVLVSEYPGEDHGALGVVTLEDVIEELIGEEIIDESDVYVDVHKAIRRLHPAPNVRLSRRLSQASVVKTQPDEPQKPTEGSAAPDANGTGAKRQHSLGNVKSDDRALSSSPKTTFLMRRTSAGIDGQIHPPMVPFRGNIDDMREHLRHLGPSNPASHPKNTRSTTVKVKPGTVVSPAIGTQARPSSDAPIVEEAALLHDGHGDHHDDDDNETTNLLRPKITGKDGVHAVRQSYGAVTTGSSQLSASPKVNEVPVDTEDVATQTALATTKTGDLINFEDAPAQEQVVVSSGEGRDGSVSPPEPGQLRTRSTVRSGSITENIVESRGIRKVVLETASSASDEESGRKSPVGHRRNKSGTAAAGIVSDVEEEDDDESGDANGKNGSSENTSQQQSQQGGKKKNRRKKRRGGGGGSGGGGRS